MRIRVVFACAAVAVVAIFGLAAAQSVNLIDSARLRGADRDAGNWLMYGRTYDDHRFSPLTAINEQTISKLGLVWSREFSTTRGLEATPLVENGVIYTTGSWSVVYALDAKTGDVRWTYDPAVSRTQVEHFLTRLQPAKLKHFLDDRLRRGIVGSDLLAIGALRPQAGAKQQAEAEEITHV